MSEEELMNQQDKEKYVNFLHSIYLYKCEVSVHALASVSGLQTLNIAWWIQVVHMNLMIKY